VAVTVSVTVRLVVLVFAGAVYVRFRDVVEEKVHPAAISGPGVGNPECVRCRSAASSAVLPPEGTASGWPARSP
jgi:hypothetical protein